MSKEFNRIVEREFAKRMPRLGLISERASGPIAWPGERCFRVESSESLAWICIYPNYKGLNEFDVEIAWSHRGAYPSTCTARPSPRFKYPEGFAIADEGFVRLGELCDPKRGAWSVEPFEQRIAILSKDEAEALALPLVDSAFQVIESVGLPVVRSAVASRRGGV